MRILFVGDEEQYSLMEKTSASHGACSFFFEPDFPAFAEAGLWDLILAPASAVLAQAKETYAAPLLAYGPDGLLDLCLGAGCADYLREPWSLDELVARAELRSRSALLLSSYGLRLHYGMLTGPLGVARLSASASAGLALLVANRARPVPREALAAAMGIANPAGRALDMAICRLRSAVRVCAGEAAGACVIARRAAALKSGAYCLLE